MEWTIRVNMLFSLLTIKVHIMAKNKVSDWSESSPQQIQPLGDDRDDEEFTNVTLAYEDGRQAEATEGLIFVVHILSIHFSCNKLASLGATLVRNSAHLITHSLTGVKCRATSVAKNLN